MIESTNGAMTFLLLDDPALLAQCAFDTYRSQGPGGQKRNKTSSGVRLRHAPTGLIVTAVEDRSQHVNKARALRRMREAIALEVRGNISSEHYVASPLLVGCMNANGGIIVGRRDQRYHAAVAEILDVLWSCGMQMSTAAPLLNTSTAQLVKFIQADGKLWEQVNRLRIELGKKPLR